MTRRLTHSPRGPLFAAVLLAVCLPAAVRAAQEPVPLAPQVPPNLRVLVQNLPKEERPVELRRSRAGAYYARLPNGAEIIVQEKRNAPVTAVQGWVRTGAIHEQESLGAGLSHFCEHLLFKGTPTRPTGILDRLIRNAGGDNNAYTTHEYTVYHITLESSGFNAAFDALSDMVMNSEFPPDEVQKEHGVVSKEIERALDNPDDRLREAFDCARYQVHPYRVPVLGYPDRFKTVTREEVYAYYKRRYAPQTTAFIAVGDFVADETLLRMAHVLAAWPRGHVAECAIPEEPEQVAPREVTVTHPLCQVPKIMLGFPTVSLRHPDLYALDVLAAILGDGRASRLYREVKDRQQLALEVSASNFTPRYAGTLAVWATGEEEKMPALRAALLAVLEAARREPPSAEELARAQRKVLAEAVFDKMKAEGVAESLGSGWLTAGDLDFSATYVAGVQRVTPGDVQRVARQYLDPQRLNVAVLLPIKPGAVYPAQPRAQAAAEDLAAQLAALQREPAVAAANLRELAGAPVFEVRLKNGLRAVVRQDRTLPAVCVTLAGLGGQRWEPAEKAGAGNLLALMLDRGTKAYTKTALAAQVEDLGATFTPFGGRNSCGLAFRGLKADLPKLLGLGAGCLLHPVFPAEEFEQARKETLAQIAQEDEDLFTLNAKVLRPLLYGSHPYGRQVLGTPESVGRIAPGDLAQLHAAWIRPGQLAAGCVGDVTALEFVKLLAPLFPAASAGEPFTPPVHQIGPLKDETRGEKEMPGIEGVMLTLGFRGVSLLDPDRECLELIANLLAGQGGRLNDVIREKKGLAYSVGVYNDSQLDGGVVIFYVQTDAQKSSEALDAIWEEVKRLREEPVAEAELDSVKKYLAGQAAIALQDQHDLAQRLALAQLFGEGVERVFSLRERLLKVTPEQVQAAARKYLDPHACALAIVKPAGRK